MRDDEVHDYIERLVREEHDLWRREEEQGFTDDETRVRLEKVRVELDRYWDLLRQRRALERAGIDPDKATLRSADIVEHYQQ